MTLAEYQTKKANLKRDIRFIEGRKKLYMDRANKCTASYGPRIGKSESRNLKPMKSAIVDMLPLSAQLDDLYRELEKLNDEFRKTIQLLHDTAMETLLVLKYIDDATEEELREALHYERSRQYELLSEARQALEKAYIAHKNADTNGQ